MNFIINVLANVLTQAVLTQGSMLANVLANELDETEMYLQFMFTFIFIL
jgi:hypothetical protein